MKWFDRITESPQFKRDPLFFTVLIIVWSAFGAMCSIWLCFVTFLVFLAIIGSLVK